MSKNSLTLHLLVTETIHQEFVRKVLEHLCEFFELNSKEFIPQPIVQADEEDISTKYKYPLIWSENSQKPVEMDKLENLVDTTDEFLMLAFEDYLFEKNEETEVIRTSLFEQ